MIDRYGDDALTAVDMRIKELASMEQHDALKLWLEIRKSVEFLTSKSDQSAER